MVVVTTIKDFVELADQLELDDGYNWPSNKAKVKIDRVFAGA